ncbi:MAG: SCP-2 sterol transfer family protein [Gammaproteobacteria bacterium]|nr:SCP-2 sterol transfer family protein [Gammaproteobacteria bacterium]
MAELFSAEWMQSFQEAWNGDPDLSGALSKIGFNSNIAYGFQGEEQPRGILVVENGMAVAAGAYEGQELSWDLRATPQNWQTWMNKGIGMMGLGMAYTTGKLKFKVGDYKSMAKDPRMAGPFIKSFSVMGQA